MQDSDFQRAPGFKNEFKNGDPVVLARGPNWGARGTFLEFRTDTKWADITENGIGVRAHPVEWLEHGTVPEVVVSKEYTG